MQGGIPGGYGGFGMQGGGYGMQGGMPGGYGTQGWMPGGYGTQGWMPGGYGTQGGGYGTQGWMQGGYGGFGRDTGGMSFERGGHRGKGPQGYMRSDERIRENVCEALSDDDNIDATSIEVTVRNGEVTLTGSIDDRATKRLAEDVVEHVPGVKDVQNQLKVRERKDRGNQSGTQQVGKQEQTGKQETESSSMEKRHRP
ncbi:MAG TPA: BON domain-containing protein, partial [Kofleriaceae bacterium]|nr:BON domain-containing protein [Kofleriaceae bacterium]